MGPGSGMKERKRLSESGKITFRLSLFVFLSLFFFVCVLTEKRAPFHFIWCMPNSYIVPHVFFFLGNTIYLHCAAVPCPFFPLHEWISSINQHVDENGWRNILLLFSSSLLAVVADWLPGCLLVASRCIALSLSRTPPDGWLAGLAVVVVVARAWEIFAEKR